MIAGLAGADQLVAAEQDHVRTGRDGLADRRLMRQAELLQAEQRPRAEVVDQGQAPGCAPVPPAPASGTSLVNPTTR